MCEFMLIYTFEGEVDSYMSMPVYITAVNDIVMSVYVYTREKV